MTPAIYNFDNQYKGDTLDATQFTLKDGSSGDPIDLTGATVRAQFRKPFRGPLVKTIDNSGYGTGITIPSPEDGVIIIDSFELTWEGGSYAYDIETTFPDGTIKTYVRGTMNVITDITL